MRRSALAAGGALTLSIASWLVLSGCPSLSEIDVGAPDSTTERTAQKPDAGVDAHDDVTARDGGVDAPPCLADVTADPHNCGRCGHDCLDGGCSNGRGQAVVLYSGDTPTAIVADGPSLFVTVDTGSASGGYFFRCSTSDCMGT